MHDPCRLGAAFTTGTCYSPLLLLLAGSQAAQGHVSTVLDTPESQQTTGICIAQKPPGTTLSRLATTTSSRTLGRVPRASRPPSTAGCDEFYAMMPPAACLFNCLAMPVSVLLSTTTIVLTLSSLPALRMSLLATVEAHQLQFVLCSLTHVLPTTYLGR